jgi:hypothetical protein
MVGLVIPVAEVFVETVDGSPSLWPTRVRPLCELETCQNQCGGGLSTYLTYYCRDLIVVNRVPVWRQA